MCNIEVEPLASAVGQDGILRGGCLPPPSRAYVPVWPIANRPQLAKLPHTKAPSAFRAHTLGFELLCQGVAPAPTSMSHTLRTNRHNLCAALLLR